MNMKQIKYLSFCCIVVFLLTACGEKKITVKGADGTEYESYQECCAANDYEAAHKYLAKMQNGETLSIDYNNAKEFVFKNEALFLMSQGDETAKKRIIYLLKEEGENNDHISMLIDLAIENDDESFVKTLGNQYTGSANTENLTKMFEYLSSKKSDNNKDYLISLFNKVSAESLIWDVAIKYDDEQLLEEYAKNHLSLYNESVLNYYAQKNQKKYSEMIIGLLGKEKAGIEGRPSIGTRNFHSCGITTDEYKSKCDNYQTSVSSLNNACSEVLSLAIKNKNRYLAQRAVSFCMTNIECNVIGWVSDTYKIQVTSNDQEKKNTIKTYQDAIHSGAFN